jgi:excinuclease ABC subunit A
VGTPEQVAAHPTSHTGRFLKPVLAGRGASVAPERGGEAPRKVVVTSKPAARRRPKADA